MLFTSYEFIGFLFLVFAVYYLAPKRFQGFVLLCASYLYYLLAGGWAFPFLLCTTVSTYYAAKKLSGIHGEQALYLKENKGLSREEKKNAKQAFLKKRRKWLLVALLFNLGILSICKYTNFAIVNVNALLHFFGRFSGGGASQLPLVNILLPLGISFYTFQSLGYLIDVYRGKYPAQGNLFQYALFVGFFPQLIQGPISRYNDLSETMFSPHSFSAADFSLGMERILWGYFKKLVIADRLLPAVNEIIRNPESYQGAFVFVGMLFYALELYADFTGGIDITIGIAQALGIRVQENFIRPYFSKSVKEYWRRWHISMGTWFTDYIFYPVSVCGPMLSLSKWARKHLGSFVGKRITVWLSCIIVWFATGVWHGASWNFIVWGLANCAILLVSQELEPFYRAFHGKANHLLMKDHQFIPLEDRAVWKCFQIIRTVLIMSCLRMFDCYRDVPLTFRMFASMFARWDFSIFANGSLLALGLDLPDYALLAFSLLLLITVSLLQRKGSVRAAIGKRTPMVRFVIWFGLFLAVLVFGAYGQGYDQSQFIYNQF